MGRDLRVFALEIAEWLCNWKLVWFRGVFSDGGHFVDHADVFELAALLLCSCVGIALKGVSRVS